MSNLSALIQLPPEEFVEVMNDMFIEVEQNANVHQLVAYSTAKARFKGFKRSYEERGLPFDKPIFLSELEKIIERQTDDIAKRKLFWNAQAVFLMHLEDKALENEKVLSNCLIEIWSHLLGCCFNVKPALENNIMWSDEDKTFFDDTILENSKTVLKQIKYLAPETVKADTTFKEHYKEMISFVNTAEGLPSSPFDLF